MADTVAYEPRVRKAHMFVPSGKTLHDRDLWRWEHEDDEESEIQPDEEADARAEHRDRRQDG